MSTLWKIACSDLRKMEPMRWLMAFYMVMLVGFSFSSLGMHSIHFVYYFVLYFIVYLTAYYGGDYLYACMPVSRRQVVLGRYFSCLLWVCGMPVVIVILRKISGHALATDLWGLLSLGMLFVAVLLPFIFHFGPVKARYYVLTVYLIGIALFIGLGVMAPYEEFATYQPGFGVVLIAAGLYIASCLISLRIYEKREFTD